MTDPALLRSAWRRLLAVAEDLAGRPVAPDLDELDTVESYRHLATLVGHAVDMFVLSRPEAPVFVRAFNADEPSERKYLGDNADTRYYYANVSADHTYRITGRRGDEVYLSFVLHGGHPTDSIEQRVVGHLNQDEIVAGPDGSFEIVLAPERPAGATNWLPLPAGAASLLSREYYLDRADARVATYTLERTDGPPAPLTAASLAVALEHAAAFLDTAMRSLAPRPGPPNVVSDPFRFGGPLPGWGTPDNTYCGCRFELGPDEALDIEGELVPCVYWNVQLWNVHMQSIGVPPRAASVNHRQAGLGPGDRFRVTVAPRDPGTRPWLDTGGHRTGTVYIRWLCAEGIPSTPTATLRRIDGG
jgi:hypothetical protein